MNQPTIALPQELAARLAQKAQAEQEIHGVMLGMTASLYERLVAGMVVDVGQASANELLPEHLHNCAKIARTAAKVFAQEFLRKVPAPETPT